MKKVNPAWMIYRTPPVFGETLHLWEEHLEKVRNWPDSVGNKAAALEQAQEMTEWKKTTGVQQARRDRDGGLAERRPDP